ncbi:hypothetical protein TYRP_003745 [Tyrophagus putrescentiae]|nr:hypothetical protein TYRP_003745 [Tyrophagus putrescentiae]
MAKNRSGVGGGFRGGNSEVGRKVGRFCDYLSHRLRAASINSRRNAVGKSSSRRAFSSSPVRFVFVLAAVPVLLLFAGLLLYAHLGDGSPEALEHLKQSSSVTAHLRYLLLQHQATVEFISAAVVLIQLMAIAGAVANWPTVLFAYVVITGLLGTVVGVVGIFGVVFSVLFHGGGSRGGRPNGLKLMAYMRRRRDRCCLEDEDYEGRRTKRQYRHSPAARRNGGHKRSTYKSIDAISSPFNSGGGHHEGEVEVDMGGGNGGDNDDDDDDEGDVFDEEDEDGNGDEEMEVQGGGGGGDNSELSHVYVDSGVPSLSTLLPPPPSKKSQKAVHHHQQGNTSSSSSQQQQQQQQKRASSAASSFAFSI